MVRLSNWGRVRQARARFWFLVPGFWLLVSRFWLGAVVVGWGWWENFGWADLGFGSFLNILIAEALEVQEGF